MKELTTELVKYLFDRFSLIENNLYIASYITLDDGSKASIHQTLWSLIDTQIKAIYCEIDGIKYLLFVVKDSAQYGIALNDNGYIANFSNNWAQSIPSLQASLWLGLENAFSIAPIWKPCNDLNEKDKQLLISFINHCEEQWENE